MMNHTALLDERTGL